MNDNFKIIESDIDDERANPGVREMTDPIDAFTCHRCDALLIPPCVGHTPGRAIELTLKCGDCGHEHRGWVEYGKRTRISETPVVRKEAA